jgi:thioredoxin 1
MSPVFIVIGSLLLLFVGWMVFQTMKMRNAPLVADHASIKTLDSKNFDHQLKSGLVLVDFWAAWCAPCRIMAPILNDLAGELPEGQRIGKVNIEQFPDLAKRFSVRNIPTMILFREGKEVSRIVGVKPKQFLQKEFQQYSK